MKPEVDIDSLASSNDMTPERWQQIERVLQTALEQAPKDRALFINSAFSSDPDLADEATSLINAYERAGDFLEQPAIVEDSAFLVGDADEKIGRTIGPYRIIERLGAGGMGEVFLAQDSRLNRLVALKILPAYFASDQEWLRRFQREARAASALNHPNILTIHEVGESNGVYFIATEFIDGQTIRQLKCAELPIEEVLDITEQIASALLAAHEAGIVHRDIKPENIMRRADGLVKILDFGIAKLLETQRRTGETDGIRTQTEAGQVLGTVNYMSPEQARGLPVDARSDIWSLGVVIYEMLTGCLPFSGDTRMDTLVAILEREAAPLERVAREDSLATLLQPVVKKALRKNKADRYATAADLLADLRDVRRQLQDPQFAAVGRKSSHASKLHSSTHASRLHGWWPILVIGVLVTVLIGAFVYRRVQFSTPMASVDANSPTINKPYAAMSEPERLQFIDQQEQRISTMMGDRPVKLNDDALRIIKLYIDRLVAKGGPSSQLGDEKIDVVYERAVPYVPLIAREFTARKVPAIVGIYLPVIESAYRKCYENSAGAKGLFQFLPETARSYGVARDEMCNVEKMAPAAAHYIADRMAELGEDSESMTLVLLSYNRGAEQVRSMLRVVRDSDDYERNFWTLFAHRNELDETFRKESAGYIPAFFAAAIIGENPRAFELKTPPLSTLQGGLR